MNRIAIVALLVVAQISGTVSGARPLLQADKDKAKALPVLETVSVKPECKDNGKQVNCSFRTPAGANECRVKYSEKGSVAVVTCKQTDEGVTFGSEFEILNVFQNRVSECSVFPSGKANLAPIVICTPVDNSPVGIHDYYVTIPKGFESCHVNFLDAPSMTCKKASKSSESAFGKNEFFFLGRGEMSSCGITAGDKSGRPGYHCLGIPIMVVEQPKLNKGIVNIPKGAKVCTLYGLDDDGKAFVQCQLGLASLSFDRDMEIKVPMDKVESCEISRGEDGEANVDCLMKEEAAVSGKKSKN